MVRGLCCTVVLSLCVTDAAYRAMLWEPGQLEREITAGCWSVTECGSLMYMSVHLLAVVLREERACA